MRETSFGMMESCKLPFDISRNYEIMHFNQSGKAHTHNKREIAICINGGGVVEKIVDGEKILQEVTAGQSVIIEAHAPHRMIIERGVMSMLIAYEKEEDGCV